MSKLDALKSIKNREVLAYCEQGANIDLMKKTSEGLEPEDVCDWVLKLLSTKEDIFFAEDCLAALSYKNSIPDSLQRLRLLMEGLKCPLWSTREALVHLTEHWEDRYLVLALKAHCDASQHVQEYIDQILEDCGDWE